MFNLIKILALSLLFVSNLQAMQAGAKTSQRPLLVFLDESELSATQRSFRSQRVELYGGGALSSDLNGALSQQAGPIIASKSLFANIMDKGKNYDAEWLIMDINESLLLLVHDKYLAQVGVNKNIFISGKSSKEQILLAEKTMGLRLTRFRPILSSSIKQEARASDFCDYFADSLDDIFVKNSQYVNEKAPQWSMYMIGHGEASKRFVGMHLESFKRVLSFFEHEMTLDVLSYLSCFSGGMNQEQVYGKSTFSFPVISQVLTDNVGHIPFDYDQKRFDLFTGAVANQENGMKAVRHIIPLAPHLSRRVKSFAEDSRWSDVPSIREAGHDHFHVMVGGNTLMAIGGPKNSAIFDEQAFLINKPNGLLLFVNELPFELRIDDPAFEVMISMVPGSATHHIKRVSSATKSIADILRTFMKVDPSEASSFGVSKSYYIEEIIDGQDNVATDAIVAITNNRWRAYFKQNASWYELGDYSVDEKPELVNGYAQRSADDKFSCIKSQLGKGLWSTASFLPSARSFGHGGIKDLIATLEAKTAFSIRNQNRTKELIKEVDPNMVLNGRPLINWVLERQPIEKGNFETDREWAPRRDLEEAKFLRQQHFILDLINIMADRGLDVTTNRDLMKLAILDRFSINIVKRLLELGAPIDVNEKIYKYWWSRCPNSLLYWLLDRGGLWDEGAFQRRFKNDFLLIKLLVEHKAPCSGADIIRHALWSRHSEDVIQYLLDNTDKLVDPYYEGILETAYRRNYSLGIIRKLCEKGAEVGWLKSKRSSTQWIVNKNGTFQSYEGGDQKLAPLDDLLFRAK